MKKQELEPFRYKYPMNSSMAYIFPGTKKTRFCWYTSAKILEITATELNVSKEKIISKTRKVEIIYVRQLVCYLARLHTIESLHSIGKTLNVDHSTVIHSIKVVENNIRLKDLRFTNMLAKVQLKIIQ